MERPPVTSPFKYVRVWKSSRHVGKWGYELMRRRGKLNFRVPVALFTWPDMQFIAVGSNPSSTLRFGVEIINLAPTLKQSIIQDNYACSYLTLPTRPHA